MKKTIQIICIAFLFAVVVAPAVVQGQFFMMPSGIEGKALPDFTLDTLKQKDVNASEYIKDQKAIVFFWATWCPHCRTALADMDERIEEFTEQGIKLVIIDLGESPETVQSYVDRHKIKLDMFLDVDSSLAEPFALVGLPTFVYVNDQGQVSNVKHSLPDDYAKLLKTN